MCIEHPQGSARVRRQRIQAPHWRANKEPTPAHNGSRFEPPRLYRAIPAVRPREIHRVANIDSPHFLEASNIPPIERARRTVTRRALRTTVGQPLSRSGLGRKAMITGKRQADHHLPCDVPAPRFHPTVGAKPWCPLSASSAQAMLAARLQFGPPRSSVRVP